MVHLSFFSKYPSSSLTASHLQIAMVSPMYLILGMQGWRSSGSSRDRHSVVMTQAPRYCTGQAFLFFYLYISHRRSDMTMLAQVVEFMKGGCPWGNVVPCRDFSQPVCTLTVSVRALLQPIRLDQEILGSWSLFFLFVHKPPPQRYDDAGPSSWIYEGGVPMRQRRPLSWLFPARMYIDSER